MGGVKNGQIETPPEKTDLVTCFWFIQKKYINSELTKIHAQHSSDSIFSVQFCSIKSRTLK